MTGTEQKRTYVIVGAGAIGGTIAFHLARAGHRILAIDADADHVAAVRTNGMTLLRDGVRVSVPVTIATPGDAPVEQASRVLFCVKGVGATEQAADWIAKRLAPDGYVVSIQNGLQVETIDQRVGAGRTVGAFVDFFADVVEPGVIADGGSGTLTVGEIDGRVTERVLHTVEDLQAWGPARATNNVLGYLWSKIGFSSMLAASALADEPMAELIHRHRAVMLVLTSEVFAVARAQHITLEPFDAFEPDALMGSPAARDAGIDRLVAWLRRQSKTRSGVWRDIAVRHRPTEAIGRYSDIIRRRTAAGLTSPYLTSLVRVLGEVESGAKPMSEDNLTEVWRDGSTGGA